MDPNANPDDMSVDVSNDVAAAEARAAEVNPNPDSTEPDYEAPAAGEPAPAKKQTADERIAELVQRAKDAEKTAFEAEMRLIEIEKAQPAPAPAPVEVAPKPGDFVYGEVDTDYLDALVAHRVAVKLASQREEFEAGKRQDDERATQASYQVKVQDTMAAGKELHADFDTIVNAAAFDGPLARLVVDSDNAVDIAYHLGNNSAELLKLTRATPEQRARIIGRLEGKFSATSAVRKQTNAPQQIGKGQPADLSPGDAKYGPSDQDAFDQALLG